MNTRLTIKAVLNMPENLALSEHNATKTIIFYEEYTDCDNEYFAFMLESFQQANPELVLFGEITSISTIK